VSFCKMKILLLFCLCVAVLSAPFSYDLNQPVRSLFHQYLLDHNVQLSHIESEARFLVFQTNVQKIKQQNQNSGSEQFGLNKFALLSSEEFKAKYLSTKATERLPTDPVAEMYSPEIIAALPDSFDWRPKGAVTDVKDQGQCGSCWAFSATGNMEGQWFLSGKTLTSLSEQNLVDCDHECLDANDCDQGCDGGLQPNAYNYVIKNNGIDTEASYTYEGVDGTCRFKSASVGTKISNWTFIEKDEDQMAAYLVAHGPLAVAVDAEIWQFYIGSGVVTLPCGTTLDHGVLIVGYGVETDIFGSKVPYWTIKNSWGADWGDSGYIYIQRGNGECGVDLYATSSII